MIKIRLFWKHGFEHVVDWVGSEKSAIAWAEKINNVVKYEVIKC